jgi:hypothetical protein
MKSEMRSIFKHFEDATPITENKESFYITVVEMRFNPDTKLKRYSMVFEQFLPKEEAT